MSGPTVILYHRTAQAHAMPWLGAMAAGLERHGITARFAPSDTGYVEPCDLAVMWGMRHPPVIDAQRKAGGRFLVMERPALGARDAWVMIGYDGLNGRADFCNADVPADRWERYWAPGMKPWRMEAGYGLILGQTQGDVATEGVDLPAFYAEAAQSLAAFHGCEVRFRPHPDARQVGPPNVVIPGGTLAEDLAGAMVAVTWNSSAAVAAVLAGVPVVCMDEGCMARNVAAHGFPPVKAMPNREDWGRGLAYTQWTHEEMAAGAAWAHLERGAPWATA